MEEQPVMQTFEGVVSSVLPARGSDYAIAFAWLPNQAGTLFLRWVDGVTLPVPPRGARVRITVEVVDDATVEARSGG